MKILIWIIVIVLVIWGIMALTKKSPSDTMTKTDDSSAMVDDTANAGATMPADDTSSTSGDAMAQ